MFFIRLYLLSVAILGVFDILWLGVVARKFYASQIGMLFREKIFFFPAIAWYLIYSAGLVFFVISPALKNNFLPSRAFLMGGFLGLIAYSTYNLTNYSTLKGWPFKVVFLDTLWGTLASAVVSALVVILANYLKWGK